jgi:Ca-activated chloride channel family protein
MPEKKIKSRFVIALDMSQSMMAKDVSPDRLERAKFKVRDLLEANPRAETSLLVFSGSTHTVIPYTTDYKLILDQVNGLKPGMMPVKGTGFKMLFTKLDSLFTEKKAQGKLLLITDDLTDLSLEMVSSFLQDHNVRLFVYPFATAKGAVIPNFKERSALDLQKMKSLEAMDNVDILEMTLDNSDVKDLAKVISNELIFEDKTDQENENWQDNGLWFVIPLTLLFLFSFRKGWALNLILISITLSSCSKTDEQKSAAYNFDDLWYTKEYQAQKKYDEKKYLEAAQEFRDPMRKGVAYYKAGDFISAQTAFEKDTTAQGLYNLGLTYAKLGQLEKSQEIFEKVLELDPENKQAASNLQHIIKAIDDLDQLQPEETSLSDEGKRAKNKQNDSPEDLSGGGQKATKKDMEKERKEETAATGKRKGKELDELPDDFKSGKGEIPKNILMRKVDDDPALFLTRKFRYQIRKKQVKAETNLKKW